MQLVSEVLFADGFWVENSVNVTLTKEEKILIGRPTCPRWEIDLVAYQAAANRIFIFECKSFLDSTGVPMAELQDGHPSKRYKLFREPVLRQTVGQALVRQMLAEGRCRANAEVRLGMIAGKIKRGDEEALRNHFDQNEWLFHGPDWLRERVRRLAEGSYTNQVSSLVAKLLLRKP